MEWREKQEEEAADAGMDVEAPGYSVLRQNSLDGFARQLMGRPLMLVALFVLLVLAVFGIFRLVGSSDKPGAPDLARLESELAAIQQRLAAIEKKPETAMDLEALQVKVDRLLQRLDRSEAIFSERIGVVERQIKAHPAASVAAPPAAPAPKPKPAASETPAKPQPEKAAARLHTVKAGDTLYSISRSAGITVETLRKINNLKPDATIHPGDRLKLAP